MWKFIFVVCIIAWTKYLWVEGLPDFLTSSPEDPAQQYVALFFTYYPDGSVRVEVVHPLKVHEKVHFIYAYEKKRFGDPSVLSFVTDRNIHIKRPDGVILRLTGYEIGKLYKFTYINNSSAILITGYQDKLIFDGLGDLVENTYTTVNYFDSQGNPGSPPPTCLNMKGYYDI